VKILSLGAGVQSSTVLLMAFSGELERPDYAIFADTQSEPKAVYDYLDYLEGIVSGVIPVLKVTRGNLGENYLATIDQSKNVKSQPPFFVINHAGDGQDKGGMLWRQCTENYKLIPIRKQIRALLKESGEVTAEQWIGI
jgi:3'-phosphoadenosine 5'-phosphosulfate sulfotransferase (PAPS reductase)/FAD synthetase